MGGCCRVTPIVLPGLSPDEEEMVRERVSELLAYVTRYHRRQLFKPRDGETQASVNLEGHAAEYAWAKYRGVAWGPIIGNKGPRFVKVPDAVDGGEVRNSKRAFGSLVLHPPGSGFGLDNPDARFDLVTGSIRTGFTWRGWIMARDGQVPAFWRADVPYPAYFVPQFALHAYPYHEGAHA